MEEEKKGTKLTKLWTESIREMKVTRRSRGKESERRRGDIREKRRRDRRNET